MSDNSWEKSAKEYLDYIVRLLEIAYKDIVEIDKSFV